MPRSSGDHGSQPLRIAHVITRLVNGGADENTVISCNHAVRAGHDVILVHGAETRPEILSAVDARVKIVELRSLVQPIAPLSDMKALRDLVRIFRRQRFFQMSGRYFMRRLRWSTSLCRDAVSASPDRPHAGRA